VGERLVTKQLPEGILCARITFDAVSGLAIFNPTAEYAKPSAPPYPAISGAPGAPLLDQNLRLAVLSSLLDAKLLDLGTPEQFATHVLGRSVTRLSSTGVGG
jgi:hypothetical protein